MRFPSKYGNPVCGECHTNTHSKYHKCTEPCSHLISWAVNEHKKEVIQQSRTAWRHKTN